MYFLMSGIILKSCPKLITYLVSKTCVLMFFKISSKIFSGNVVCVVNWITRLLVTNWLIGYGKPTQFEWSGPFNSTSACNTKSFPYNSLLIWTKESCICSSFCQSIATFAFIGSHFLNTCCPCLGFRAHVFGYISWQQQLHQFVL
jgi:hypothetical protein